MLESRLDVDKFLADKPFAITIAGLEELKGHILARLAIFDSGPRSYLEGLVETLAAARAQPQLGRPVSGAGSSTGIIPIRGTISQHAASEGDLSSMLFAGTATEDVAAQLDAFLADESISKIVLNIDSPGGSTFGVSELANRIMAARGKKPIIAVANSLAASAAYHIGSAADQFFAAPGSIVGSIGVYTIHQDLSKMAEQEGVKTTLISAGKFKTAGNQFEPLDDATRQRAQARVDETYATMVHDVARGRGTTDAAVRGGFGEGDVLGAKAAKAEGMVDGIATLEQVLGMTFKPASSQNGQAATWMAADADIGVDIEDDTEDDEPITPPADEEAAKRLARMRAASFRARAAAGAV